MATRLAIYRSQQDPSRKQRCGPFVGEFLAFTRLNGFQRYPVILNENFCHALPNLVSTLRDYPAENLNLNRQQFDRIVYGIHFVCEK